MSDRKAYLGDAVYVELKDSGDVILTTENGYSETNRIVLEPEVFGKFLLWLAGGAKPGVCDRCGAIATRFNIDGTHNKKVCAAYPTCAPSDVGPAR